MAPFLANLYLWSYRVFSILHGGCQNLFEGFWLAFLPESAVDIIAERSYERERQYVADNYLDRGFFFWEQLAVTKYFRSGSHVLVTSAGGGREMIAFARADFKVSGFECNRAMLQSCRKALADRSIEAVLTYAPPSTAPSMNDTFDGLVVGWNGYTYVVPRSRRIRFLQDLRRQLRPGAPMLLSAAISQGPRYVRGPRLANWIRRLTFRPALLEPGDTFLYRRKKYFYRRDLRQEIVDAGFVVEELLVWGGEGAVIARNPDQ